MTRTRPTACPGSGGGRLQRRVSARGVTCNVDSRGKLDGTRGTRGGQRGRLEQGSISSFFPFTASTGDNRPSSYSLISTPPQSPSSFYSIQIVRVPGHHLSLFFFFFSTRNTSLTNKSSNTVNVLPTYTPSLAAHAPGQQSSYLPTNSHSRSNVPSPWMTRRWTTHTSGFP